MASRSEPDLERGRAAKAMLLLVLGPGMMTVHGPAGGDAVPATLDSTFPEPSADVDAVSKLSLLLHIIPGEVGCVWAELSGDKGRLGIEPGVVGRVNTEPGVVGRADIVAGVVGRADMEAGVVGRADIEAGVRGRTDAGVVGRADIEAGVNGLGDAEVEIRKGRLHMNRASDHARRREARCTAALSNL